MRGAPVFNNSPATMQLRVGYELLYDFPQPTPMVLMLHIHQLVIVQNHQLQL